MRFLMTATVLLALTACASTPSTHGSRSRLVYVAAQKAPCKLGIARTSAECLQYREQPNQPWQINQAPVEGFDWQAGNEYLLKITEVQIRPANADEPTVRWHVDKIVEQHPVP
ncbi:DUF4377 domain-containing protein [Luteibacter sp. PPL201]|jgi:hypothetical protein|uniref:DUF4377 domain-containing protein n=1 Tax=Luteibacter sahnii TaxID=3021977 RepID=A0ABT6B5G9_9GAMM